jgi:hypothetical protein
MSNTVYSPSRTMTEIDWVEKNCEAVSQLIGNEGCSQLIRLAMEMPWGQ